MHLQVTCTKDSAITLAPIVLLLSTAVHVVKLAGYLRWRSGDRIQLWHQRAPGRKWEGCTTPGREKGGSMYRPQGHTTAQVSVPGLLLQRDCKIATSIPRSSLEVNLPVFHTILYGCVLVIEISFYRRLYLSGKKFICSKNVTKSKL